MKAYSKEKNDIIRAFQDAVGRSEQKLNIIINLSKRESISELSKRLKIPQPTVSKAITSLKSYGLIISVGRKGNSDIYDRVPLLKTFSNLRSLVDVEIREENIMPKKIKKINGVSNVPFLDYVDEKNAQSMAEPYTLLYLFENSLRKFISKKLTDKYGSDWWNKINVKADLVKVVKERREKEGSNKWHVPRGANEIFYTDLGDLTYLLNKEKAIFESEINLEHWGATIKNAISLSRNIVDHHNPLPSKEVKRLKIILDDWKKEFSGKKK